MAWIEKRVLKNGAVTWRVKWRDGGRRGGRQESDTFVDFAAAKRFAGLVEANGERRPPVPVNEPAPRDEAESCRPVLFGVWARRCVDERPLSNGYTRHRYVRALELHIEPYLGDRPVVEITRAELATWQKVLQGKGLSAKSVNNCRAVVSLAFRAACREGDNGEPPLRVTNPLDGLAQPRVILKPPTLLETPEQVGIFLDCAYEVHPDLGDLLLVKLVGGFRFGELVPIKRLALTGRQEVAVLDVRRLDERGNVIVVEDAKSEAGFGRRVPMADVAWRVLQGRAKHLERKGLLFASPFSGGLWSYSTVRNGFTRAVDLAARRGLELEGLTPHGLRKSCNTWLHDYGVSERVRKRILGHASERDAHGRYLGITAVQRVQAIEAGNAFLAKWRAT